MAWLIQRTAPGDPVAYWGKNGRWIHRRGIATLQEVGRAQKIPELAMRFESYEAAFDVAEYRRTHEPLAHGEVIAVVTEPEAAVAA